MSPSPETAEAAPLPDDVATLKALLLAERATAAKLAGHNEQLRAIDQGAAAGPVRPALREGGPSRSAAAGPRGHRAGARREPRREEEKTDATLASVAQAAAPCQSRRAAQAPAARRGRDRARRARPARAVGGAMHRIGEDVAERLDVIPAQFRVIVTRRPKYGCRACESAVVQAPAPARLIEGGLPTESAGRPCAGRQVRRPPAALSPEPDLRPARDRARSLDPGGLGRPGCRRAPPPARAAARAPQALAQAVHGRDPGAGARSGTQADQDRLPLGDRPRRPALGRHRSAGGRLSLRAGPRRRACHRAARRLQRHPPGRRLRRLQGAWPIPPAPAVR